MMPRGFDDPVDVVGARGSALELLRDAAERRPVPAIPTLRDDRPGPLGAAEYLACVLVEPVELVVGGRGENAIHDTAAGRHEVRQGLIVISKPASRATPKRSGTRSTSASTAGSMYEP
jgi:hypothetical protein